MAIKNLFRLHSIKEAAGFALTFMWNPYREGTYKLFDSLITPPSQQHTFHYSDVSQSGCLPHGSIDTARHVIDMHWSETCLVTDMVTQ